MKRIVETVNNFAKSRFAFVDGRMVTSKTYVVEWRDCSERVAYVINELNGRNLEM